MGIIRGDNTPWSCFLGPTSTTRIATNFGQGEVVVTEEGIWMIESFLSHKKSVDRHFVSERPIHFHTLLGCGRSRPTP